MLLIIGYCLFGGAIMFGLLFLLYSKTVKNGNNHPVLLKMPVIIGVLNLIISSGFLFLYALNPSAFSAEQTILSPLLYVLFTIFSIYFYILALPLSIGYVGISISLYKKNHLTPKYYWVSLLSNILGAVLIATFTYLVFA